MAASNPDGDLPSSLQQQESAERRRLLLQYVKDVQPALIEQFVEAGPPAVVAAMKNTITNMLGTLPPAFFSVTISTVAENLSQLMLSVCMTGYMFRNAQYRLELHSALGTMPPAAAAAGPALRAGGPYASAAVPAVPAGGASSSMQRSQSAPVQGGVLDQEAYAPGVQKSRVQGDVLLWHKENGLETLEAVAYIELLEGEVARLRQQLDQQQPPQLPQALQQQQQQQPPLLPQQLQQQAPPALPQPGQQPVEPMQPPAVVQPQPRQLPVPVSSSQALQQAGVRSSSSSSSGPAAGLLVLEEPSNELLDYLRCLDAASLAELTGCAGPEVSQAMDCFVARLMGTSDKDSLSRAGSDCSAQELAKVMFWLMVVGYSLRGMEVRWEVERSVSSGQQQQQPGGGGGGGRAGWLGGWGGGGRDLGQDTW